MIDCCIIGAGTYGSYLAYALSIKSPDLKILLIDVGDDLIRDEEAIGYQSNLVGKKYKGTKTGRFFGLGGTSNNWGGQLLFYSESDFEDSQLKAFLKDNERYKNVVISKFFSHLPTLHDEYVNNDLQYKQGIWLKYNKRNLYKYFKLAANKNVKTLKNARVIKINTLNNRVASIVISEDGLKRQIYATNFYLTAGAFESMRLLASSEIIKLDIETHNFSDHASIKCFEINNNTSIKILGKDLRHAFSEGSFVTSRFIGNIDGDSFFVHPAYNEDFVFFNFLKDVIFKRKFNATLFWKAFSQTSAVLKFCYYYVFKKKLYVFKRWQLNIDIEVDGRDNHVSLSQVLDKFQQPGLNVSFNIPETTVQRLRAAKEILRAALIASKIDFVEIDEEITADKLEDVFHPFNLTSDISVNPKVYENLHMFHTGILKRAGGINPTASIFCLIEKHISEELENLTTN